MWNVIKATVCVLLCANITMAADYSTSSGKLSDDDFYRAITCKAVPNQSCQTRVVRWPAKKVKRLKVAFAGVQSIPKNGAYAKAARLATIRAVAQINGANSGVNMRLVKGPATLFADIKVFLVAPQGKAREIRGTRFPLLNGQKIANAISVSATLKTTILGAGIGISVDRVAQSQLDGIVLEELIQSLGLTWDIHNPYYENRSVFAQVGQDDIVNLTGQDAMVLRRHYPR